MTTKNVDVLIVGSGPAGYSAAIYAARAGLHPVLVSGMQAGGQLTTTTDVENYPGFASAVQGPELMEAMRAQAEHVGAVLVADVVTALEERDGRIVATCDSGDVYAARSTIVATGAQARWLGVEGEREFSGYGVSACATCDGFFFRGKSVAVVGGANTAVEEALYLGNIAAKVTLIHRRGALRAEAIMVERLRAHPRIEVIWDSVIESVVGERSPTPGVTGVVIRDVRDGSSRTLPVDGVFVAIGHDPATSLLRGLVDMDEAGYVKVAPWSTDTSNPLIQAAGDVMDPVFRQAVVAAGSGCMAALEAERKLAAASSDPAVRGRAAVDPVTVAAY